MATAWGLPTHGPELRRFSMGMVKVIVADRSWMVRDSVAHLARECFEGTATVGAEDRAQLGRALAAHPDAAAVLIDEAIVADDEEAVFAHVRGLAPRAVIGVLMGCGSRERVLKAIYYGATAVLLKAQNRDDFRDALALALEGKVSIPHHVLARGAPPSPGIPPAPPAGDAIRSITSRSRRAIPCPASRSR